MPLHCVVNTALRVTVVFSLARNISAHYAVPIFTRAVAGYNGVGVKEGMPRFLVAARDDDSMRVIEALKQLYRCNEYAARA